MIIKPNMFMDLNTCTLKIGSEILKELLEKKEVKYSKLFSKLEEKYKDDTEYIFPEALSFLYLLGKIEYKIKNDTVRLIL